MDLLVTRNEHALFARLGVDHDRDLPLFWEELGVDELVVRREEDAVPWVRVVPANEPLALVALFDGRQYGRPCLWWEGQLRSRANSFAGWDCVGNGKAILSKEPDEEPADLVLELLARMCSREHPHFIWNCLCHSLVAHCLTHRA